MKKEYNFDTLDYGKAKIILNDDTLTISRSGLIAKMKYGHTGERTIIINQISAVEVKEAKMTMGHIQFILAGTIAKKQPLFSSQKNRVDDNTIMFGKKEKNVEAKEIKEYIENYNSQNHNSTTVIQESDKYDQLSKLKKLLDENVISQEEFDSEKSKLLNKN